MELNWQSSIGQMRVDLYRPCTHVNTVSPTGAYIGWTIKHACCAEWTLQPQQAQGAGCIACQTLLLLQLLEQGSTGSIAGTTALARQLAQHKLQDTSRIICANQQHMAG